MADRGYDSNELIDKVVESGYFSLLLSPFLLIDAISTMIMALHLTGRYIESRLRDRASKQVRALLSL